MKHFNSTFSWLFIWTVVWLVFWLTIGLYIFRYEHNPFIGAVIPFFMPFFLLSSEELIGGITELYLLTLAYWSVFGFIIYYKKIIQPKNTQMGS